MTVTWTAARRGLAVCAVVATVAALLATSVALGASHEISIVDGAFKPAELTVLTGEPVTWTNASGVNHTVTSDDGAELDSGPIGPGEAYGHVFEVPGTYAYHCTIHSTMHGTITVVAAPATPVPSGSLEPTPPAGTLPPDFSPFPSAEPAATAAPTPTATPAPTPAATTRRRRQTRGSVGSWAQCCRSWSSAGSAWRSSSPSAAGGARDPDRVANVNGPRLATRAVRSDRGGGKPRMLRA